MRKFFNKPPVILVLYVLLSVIPLSGILYKIWSGEFALWYDPARDLLSGLENLQKPTLIGPTSGIPGVFYGPYWIWLLSLGEIFSRNPRIVTFIVATIPYVIFFPFILSRFSQVISLPVIGMLWVLFLLKFNNYFTDLWNPHPAPLLILLAIYLQFSKTNKLSFKNILITFFAGFTGGLVMNFHLSFGIGMLLGSLMYVLGESVLFVLKAKQRGSALVQRIVLIAAFFVGNVIAFSPFLLFEVRHQFLQTNTLLNAFIHFGGGVVGLQGLTKPEIVQSFFGIGAQLLQLPMLLAVGIILIMSIFYGYLYRQRKDPEKGSEIKLLFIVGCITLGVLFIYLTAKNPVWLYHFIGVEILFLLFIGVIISRLQIVKILLCWVVLLVTIYSVSFFSRFSSEQKILPGTLLAEEKIVEKVHNESNKKDYTVFAYSPSIYIYEYAYLFQTMYRKDVPYRPELNPQDSQLVFLIVPPQTKELIKQDFINFRTPGKEYSTTAAWVVEDGTQIIKRERIKE